MLYAIVTVLVIILDQWVKYWVSNHLAVGVDVKELISGVVSMVNVHNDGCAFGFLSGSDARIYFIILCGVFTVGIIIALATRLISGPVGRWSAVFVMAGGISNCIDRLLYGYVQDMFSLDFFPRFAVFNVADIFITVFCLVFILYVLFGGDKPEYDDDDDQYDDEDDEEQDSRPLFDRRNRRVEEEESASVRRREAGEEPERKPTRQQRKSKYDEEYEQYKANRAARQKALAESGEAAEPVAKRPAPRIDPADPFAEWERANARVEEKKHSYTAALQGQQNVEVPEPVHPAPGRSAPVEQEVNKPGSDEEFSLEDILAEFK